MENWTLFKLLGGIIRILKESETLEEAGAKIEMFLVDIAHGEAVGNFYDGMFNEIVERISEGK